MLDCKERVPLNDEEICRLDGFLLRMSNGSTGFEDLDGFLAAMICAQGKVPPSEFIFELWGGFSLSDDWYADRTENLTFHALLLRHWIYISRTLAAGLVYTPWLNKNGRSKIYGADWACGFLLGMSVRSEHWLHVLQSDALVSILDPILKLATDHALDVNPDAGKVVVDINSGPKTIDRMAMALAKLFKLAKEPLNNHTNPE